MKWTRCQSRPHIIRQLDKDFTINKYNVGIRLNLDIEAETPSEVRKIIRKGLEFFNIEDFIELYMIETKTESNGENYDD